jgi:hypothetical protein
MNMYIAVIPVTPFGLLLNIGRSPGGYFTFIKYIPKPDGTKGPAELSNLIHAVGDNVIAVDGTIITGKDLEQAEAMMSKKCASQKSVVLRILEGNCELLKRHSTAMQEGGGDCSQKPGGGGNQAIENDDDSYVEDVTEQCLRERASKRKILELSSDDDEVVDNNRCQPSTISSTTVKAPTADFAEDDDDDDEEDEDYVDSGASSCSQSRAALTNRCTRSGSCF